MGFWLDSISTLGADPFNNNQDNEFLVNMHLVSIIHGLWFSLH